MALLQNEVLHLQSSSLNLIMRLAERVRKGISFALQSIFPYHLQHTEVKNPKPTFTNELPKASRLQGREIPILIKILQLVGFESFHPAKVLVSVSALGPQDDISFWQGMDGAFPSSLGEGGGDEERRRGFRGTQENAKTKLCLRFADILDLLNAMLCLETR